ncbi:hypothetical protein M514_08669 [Trichuris suis]|uniref:Uncharacterized protein n=1 Tax=Trichuris suis TaxID=68888 RepID=A0A085LZP6_9BILA|nr:hypothetical protein M513_08669 [Trichuris suis]KFD62321.1 hypothetical protein M514_08669 [Trichuris suis]
MQEIHSTVGGTLPSYSEALCSDVPDSAPQKSKRRVSRTFRPSEVLPKSVTHSAPEEKIAPANGSYHSARTSEGDRLPANSDYGTRRRAIIPNPIKTAECRPEKTATPYLNADTVP